MSNEITYFNSFISQRYTGIPYSTQWMVHIDGIPDVVSKNLRDVDTQMWSISRAASRVRQAADTAHNVVDGNIFAQAVTVPGERLDIQYVGIDGQFRGGFMPAPVLNSRNNNDLITIDFLETRDSFVDLVVRPWLIQVGYRGLIPSKDERDSIKTLVTVIYFDRGDAEKKTPPTMRKMWKFHNAVPVAIDPDTSDYQKNQIPIIKTQWLYTHYTIETEGLQLGNTKPASITPKLGTSGSNLNSVISKPTNTTTNQSTVGKPFSTLSHYHFEEKDFGNGVKW